MEPPPQTPRAIDEEVPARRSTAAGLIRLAAALAAIDDCPAQAFERVVLLFI